MRTINTYASIYKIFVPYYNTIMNVNGIAYTPDFYPYTNSMKTYTIEPSEEYRPDKIAYNIWNDQNMFWILDAINNFTHGIKEYYSGRTIKYIELSTLQSIGLI